MTSGMPQRSILGPERLFDCNLESEIPSDTEFVGYDDAVKMVVQARTVEQAQWKLNDGTLPGHGWNKYTFMLTRKYIPTEVTMKVGVNDIETAVNANYVDVTLDTKLNIWGHIQRAAEKLGPSLPWADWCPASVALKQVSNDCYDQSICRVYSMVQKPELKH